MRVQGGRAYKVSDNLSEMDFPSDGRPCRHPAFPLSTPRPRAYYVQKNIERMSHPSPQPATPPPLTALRSLLRERFPQAHAAGHLPSPATTATTTPAPESVTSVPALDALRPPAGALTEIVCPRPGHGGALLLHQLLHHAALHGRPQALIDGRDSFDPHSQPAPGPGADRLLWLRCHNAPDSIHAADLLLRDGNLDLLLIDLQLNPAADIAKVPDSSWHRLRMLMQGRRGHCFILTPKRTVPRAELRVQLTTPLRIDALEHTRAELLAGLGIQSLLQRHHHQDHPAVPSIAIAAG